MIKNFFQRFIELTPAQGRPASFPTTVFGTLKQVYALDKWRWNSLVAIATVAAVIEPGIMWCLGQFVNLITSGELQPEDALGHPYFIAIIVLFLVVLPGFDSVENVIQNLLINAKVAQRTRFRAMNYLTHQSMDFFSNEMAGRLAAKCFEFSRSAVDLMMTVLTQTWFVIAFFFGTLAFCIHTNWMLAVCMSVWGLVSLIMIAVFTPIIAKRADRMTESYSTAIGRCVDILSNMSLTKLFSKPESENNGFMGLLNDHLFNSYQKNKVVTLSVAMIYVWNGICVAAIMFISIWLWTKGEIQVGTLVALFPLVLRIRVQTDWLFMQASMISENYGSVLNGIEIFQRPITIQDAPEAGILPAVKGNISFDDVSFTYSSSRQIFDGLNLTIPAGQKVGLVGPSGAGKTTLVSLLLRFYDIQSGTIKIDGHDISQVTQDSLRSYIGMVTQEPALLNRSILDNLRYGRMDATREEIQSAVRQAAAHEFIPHLRDKMGNTGYDAQVGERGVKLSGGQRQRIAIARLILKNAPIMLLDEATSALDSEVEAVVQEQIYPLMKNRTVIPIAHRLSTLMQMDRLIVMEHGKIIEDGTHTELLALNGLYARLWNRQSQGFLPKD